MTIDTYPTSFRLFATTRRLPAGGFAGLIAGWRVDAGQPVLAGRYVTLRCRTQRSANKQSRKALRVYQARRV